MSMFKKLTTRYSAASSLARNATGDDPQGPTTRELHELNILASRQKTRNEVYYVLESRLKQSPKHWRNIAKALGVLHYFMIQDSTHCKDWLEAHRNIVTPLETFKYISSKNIDQGRSIRERSVALLALLDNPEKLRTERDSYQKAKAEIRNSIGRQTSSRHTLDIVRGLEDDFSELSPTESQAAPRHSLQLPLGAIQEELS